MPPEESSDVAVETAVHPHLAGPEADDWWQDEQEAMADMRNMEVPASDRPPNEQEEREAEVSGPGELTQELKDRIAKNREEAMQRKLDRRIFGPVAPTFTPAKSFDGSRETGFSKKGPKEWVTTSIQDRCRRLNW